MRTIWKFPLGDGGPQRVEMSKGTEVLTVQTQDNRPCLWAVVDPDAEVEVRYFEIFGTGQNIHEDMGVDRKYIGTFQQPPYVWHLFEGL